jgi:2-alkenal reductase
VISRKYLLFIIPLALAVLACTCSSQGFLPAPTSPPVVVVATPTPLPEEAFAESEAEDALLINLYQRVNPSVVYIAVLVDSQNALFPLGSGSGFVYDANGHIVTNNHVVESASTVQVTFSDGSVADARIVGCDSYSDLAVLRVDVPADRLLPLELGDSSALQVGQRVVAIGNPFGLRGTMTVGIVSAVGRTLPSLNAQGSGSFANPEIVQTDAAINPGNSGGPLLDIHGCVVGVNTAINSETGVNSGVGFAVPVNTVKRIVPHLIEEGVYHYPYLGISSDNRLSLAQLAEPLGLPVTQGVLISGVFPGTAAEQAGLRGGDQEVEVLGLQIVTGGDIITAIDGYHVRDYDDFIAYLVRETEVRQRIVLTIVRDGEEMQVPVTLGERP